MSIRASVTRRPQARTAWQGNSRLRSRTALEVIKANHCGTWTINALTGHRTRFRGNFRVADHPGVKQRCAGHAPEAEPYSTEVTIANRLKLTDHHATSLVALRS